MVLAVDIDGTLNRFGDFFQVSIPAWQKAGMKVGIITGRPEKDKLPIAEALKKAGIIMDFLLFKPEEFDEKHIPNGVWKGVLCHLMNVDILFDDMEHDDPSFITDFAQVTSKTQIFTPINYKREEDARGNTTSDYARQVIEALETKLKP